MCVKKQILSLSKINSFNEEKLETFGTELI